MPCQTVNLLYRLQNGGIGDLHPDIFWLLIGTNDLAGAEAENSKSTKCSVESIVAGNIAIIEELKRMRPGVTVVINSLLPRPAKYWRFLSSVNDRLECYASTTSGVEFFNATDLFAGPDLTLLHLPDELHPDADGSRLWARAIADKVLELSTRS
jgi:lysophospholipase L1-like esterase